MWDDTPFNSPRSSYEQPVTAPDIDPDAGPFVSLIVQVDWLPFVLGCLSQLQQRTTWTGDKDAQDLAMARALLLSNMVAGPTISVPGVEPGPPPIIRYDPDCDCVQYSPDGGTTWVTNEEADPRITTTKPPIKDEADPKCLAAASVVKYVKRIIDNITGPIAAGTTAGGIALGLVTLLTDLGPYGILIGVLGFAALNLIAIGAGTITASMTVTVYDELLCILMCNFSDTGSMTGGALSEVYAEIDDQIGGEAAVILHILFGFMGFGGLSGAARLKLATDDCSGCGCVWCFEFDFTVGQFDWYIGYAGTYAAGTGFKSVTVGSNTQLDVQRVFAAQYVTTVEVTFNRGHAANGGTSVAGFYNAGVLFSNPGVSTAIGSHTQTLTVNHTTDKIEFAIDTSGFTAVNTISKVVVRGVGDNPFGENNCT